MFPGTVAFLNSGTAVYLGKATNRLPIVYAGYVAEACILAATTGTAAGQAYNTVSGEIVTQRGFFETIAAASGLRLPKRSLPFRFVYALALAMEATSVATGRRKRPSTTRFGLTLLGLDYREDASKARSQLGWEPKVMLAETIQRTIDWRRSHRPVAAGG
jgi:nucleoside-diphosphate-sugar epimerase